MASQTLPGSNAASNVSAPTLSLEIGGAKYAYRSLGRGAGLPLLCLQHFTGTLDNWDPAVIDPLARRREVILFDNAGIGRSSGVVPPTVSAMARHAFAFLDGLGIPVCDVLGFSLGGMVAQQMALDRPSIFRRLLLVGTAPRGGDDIMHLEKPNLAQHLRNPELKGYALLQKLFFANTDTSQRAGAEFVARLEQRAEDREPRSQQAVAQAQIAAFREWEHPSRERFADLKRIGHPAFVVSGVHDDMIPVANSYYLGENLPNAILLTYPDSGHGALYQFHESFVRHADAFLAAQTSVAPY
jgi:pimeloyl-ACP methyl ester carboxylesterase